MNIPDLNSAALMFVGVNEGYRGEDFQIKTPAQAALVANSIIAAGKRILRDGNDYFTHPAIAVYPPTWGCLIGGEPVAAIITNDDCANAEKMARHLQARFKQHELTLAMFDEEILGQSTLNFHALLDSNLSKFGCAWQEAAGRELEKSGIYVSVGAYEAESGIVISAQANHSFQADFSRWKDSVHAVCTEVSEQLGKQIKPEFSEVRYIYLNEKDLQKSTAKTTSQPQIR